MEVDTLLKLDQPATSLRQRTVIAFDFEDLFRLSDEAVLQRFRLTQKVNPTEVPRDFRPDACRISRDLDAITLHFLKKKAPEDPGTEIFRFSFQSLT